MRLLDGHQMGDLDPVPVGMGDIERGKRSADMEAKYLHAIRIQALFISSAAGIRIGLADGEFFRDDALRLLRQRIQEVSRRPPEQNDEPSQRDLHEFLRLLDPLDILDKPPLLFMLDHLLYQFREGHPRLPHTGEGGPDLFPDNDALCGIHGIYDIRTVDGKRLLLERYSPAASPFGRRNEAGYSLVQHHDVIIEHDLH